MKKLFYILIIWSQFIVGQTVVPWTFQSGGDLHRFQIYLKNILRNGQSFTSSTSDAIGIFERKGGDLVCLGYTKYLNNGTDSLDINATTAAGIAFQPNSDWIIMYWDSTNGCSRILEDTLANKTLQNGGFTVLNKIKMNDWSYQYSTTMVMENDQDVLPIRSDSITPFKIFSNNSQLKVDSTSGKIFVSQSLVGSYVLSLVTNACITTSKSINFQINPMVDSIINPDTVPLAIINQKCKMLGSIEVLSVPVGYTIDLIRVLNNDTLLALNNNFDSLSAGSYILRYYNSVSQKYSSKYITLANDCINPVLSFILSDPEPVFISDAGKGTIYNREGKLVNQFTAPFEWNGTDQGGANLPTGDYIVFVNNVKYQTITIVR